MYDALSPQSKEILDREEFLLQQKLSEIEIRHSAREHALSERTSTWDGELKYQRWKKAEEQRVEERLRKAERDRIDEMEAHREELEVEALIAKAAAEFPEQQRLCQERDQTEYGEALDEMLRVEASERAVRRGDGVHDTAEKATTNPPHLTAHPNDPFMQQIWSKIHSQLKAEEDEAATREESDVVELEARLAKMMGRV